MTCEIMVNLILNNCGLQTISLGDNTLVHLRKIQAYTLCCIGKMIA